MAHVYADLSALRDFQARLNQTVAELERQSTAKEDLIQSTIAAIQASIDRAEELLHAAQQALTQAEDQLAEAERQTQRINSSRESDQPMESTPQFYYDNVSHCQERRDEAQDALDSAQAALQRFQAHVRRYRQEMEEALDHYRQLLRRSGQFFVQYIRLLIQAKQATATGSAGGSRSAGAGGGAGTDSGAPQGAGNGGTPPGWCPQNSMSAVHLDSRGHKCVTLTIGGSQCTFPCTKAGMESAYRQAVRAGDGEMIRRTGAMFEIETFRESLALGPGDPAYPQLGGYHRDVKDQDPPGFESHHIPSRSVQRGDADRMPALSISDEDHKHTSSYAGKQSKRYPSIFPSSIPDTTYKETVENKLGQGPSGYLDALKGEVLDLIQQTGSRYHGGISAFLDAVMDMLSTTGIPEPK
jgi:tetratricopeptide (TPR) repeat protein